MTVSCLACMHDYVKGGEKAGVRFATLDPRPQGPCRVSKSSLHFQGYETFIVPGLRNDYIYGVLTLESNF